MRYLSSGEVSLSAGKKKGNMLLCLTKADTMHTIQ